MRILTLSNDGAVFYKLKESASDKQVSLEVDSDFPTYPRATESKFAPHSGKFAVIADEMGLHFVSTETGKETRFIMKNGPTGAIEFSPKDTYLVACDKFKEGEKNLVIWNTQTGKEVAQFEWKKQSKEGPKSIKFSKDERFCARLASKTTIEVYENGNFEQPKTVLVANAENLGKKKDIEQKTKFHFDSLEFIPQNPDNVNDQAPLFLFAMQFSEGLSENLAHGNVFVYDLKSNLVKPKFSIQCSKAQEINIRPSPTGYAALIWSQDFVDQSGKSYYGEHSLQYIQLYGGKARTFVPVFDGMIHDIKWSSTGDYFIVISGTQPSTATLYDKNSNPLFEFGKRYRNTIRIDPFSNAAIIGGFGNLAGEIDVWDLGKHVELGKTKSYCTVGIEWAPDGIHFMTAVLYERVKVDNEIKIFKANGQLLCSKGSKELQLYEAYWQPYPKGSCQQPNLNALGKNQEEQKAEAKPKKLFKVPGSNSVFSQIMRQEMSKTNEKQAKHVDKGAYQDLMKEQAQQHADLIANSGQKIPSEPAAKQNWRSSNSDFQPQPQPQPETMNQNILAEEQKISKHAKRRAKKKQKIVVCEGGDNNNNE